MLNSRTRSRSPARSPSRRDGDRDRERRRERERCRERSRDRGDGHRSHHHPSRHHHSSPPTLPFHRAPLTKTSLHSHTQLFQSYLSTVKNLSFGSLSETEAKGRWKSFTGKWNRGELSEEWYNHPSLPPPSSKIHTPSFSPAPSIPELNPGTNKSDDDDGDDDDDDDDDEYIPPLPTQNQAQQHGRHGPAIPTRDDLTHRDELLETERGRSLDDHRYERKTFRKFHREQLDELVPKADPGSRERKLERKREVTEKLKGFGQDKEQGVEEVNEGDLMGGDDAIEELKRMKKLREERQNQRQSRREEEEMLRRQEREERVRGYKEREERVMEGLRGLVRERFGGC
ncbi:hypothetical protein QC764_408940 [Podospora pseudoanserina]|uniref:RNA helicase n=1 Tax=Podospora pseudoanserina TaxID=2609844 RepID=A0ABR0I9G7_9PEZI|nr:hypothetical protein QC764_408940 [Podospora pseudoanserina]